MADKETEAAPDTLVQPRMEDAEAGGEVPPSYQEGPEGSREKPPSYDSLIDKVRQAKSESSGNVDYIGRVIALFFCGTFCTAIYLFFLFALPVAMVTIGVIYKEDCPAEKYIPIYLIVGGSFCIVVGVITICCKACKGHHGQMEDEEDERNPNPVSSLINCFLFAWFIAGNYWVYHIYKIQQPDDPKKLDTYCQNTLYQFAFWLITVYYILLGISLFCCCGIGLLMMCVALGVALRGN